MWDSARSSPLHPEKLGIRGCGRRKDSRGHAACNVFSANVKKKSGAAEAKTANKTVLTWGRSDDASLFVDSDLFFVLFRLPIACPVWWGIWGSDSESEANG